MTSSLKITICVALICATAVSANERNKRGHVIDLRARQPYQLQLPNIWRIQNIPNGANIPYLETLRYRTISQDLNGRNEQNSQQGNSLQSDRQYNIQQQSGRGDINTNSLQDINSVRQNENGINWLQRANRYSGANRYNSGSSSEAGQRNLGINNGQRQSQFSNEIRNTQSNSPKPSVVNNQVSLLRSISWNYNPEQRPDVLGASGNLRQNEWSNAQREENTNSLQGIGYNQNTLGREGSQNVNVQRWPSQLGQVNNDINSQVSENIRTDLNLRGNLLQNNYNGNQQNNDDGQAIENNTEENRLRGFSSQNLQSVDNRETSLQSQTGRYSNQRGPNQIRGWNQQLNEGLNRQRNLSTGKTSGNTNGLRQETEGRTTLESPLLSQTGRYSNQGGLNQIRGRVEEVRGNNGWNTRLNEGLNRQRKPSTGERSGNTNGLRQETEERTNSGSTQEQNQDQGVRNQENGAQQQKNSYTYGELSANILKVFQSNPSMLSDINGLIDELVNDKNSSNLPISQLKSLLQEIGKFTDNLSSSRSNSEGQRQQNPLVRNLLEVMDKTLNNPSETNVPTSYQSFRSWRY